MLPNYCSGSSKYITITKRGSASSHRVNQITSVCEDSVSQLVKKMSQSTTMPQQKPPSIIGIAKRD